MPREKKPPKKTKTTTTTTTTTASSTPSVMPNLTVAHASLATNKGVSPRIPLLN